MGRSNCISNRNIQIVHRYLTAHLGNVPSLFDGLPYPSDEYDSAESFFLNESEWTSFENFDQVFRKAKALADDPDFFYKCGASAARYHSWGRFHHFAWLFSTPDDGFRSLPFFNQNFNDTKRIEVILPPSYDVRSGKMRALLQITHHGDFDVNRDYIRDPYLRGIIASIPTVWGLSPAVVRQTVNAYDPEILFNQEPEFVPYRLDARMEGDVLTIRDPGNGRRRVVGERVSILPQQVNGRWIYLGKHVRPRDLSHDEAPGTAEAILIIDNVRAGGRVLLHRDDLFKAPYFVVHVSYERLSTWQRISRGCRPWKGRHESENELKGTIDELRDSMRAKTKALADLEKTHSELQDAKARLDEYAHNLERKVEERTAKLQKAQEDLLKLNQNLEERVSHQVVQLEKYKELRRYLSPKLTERILSADPPFGSEPRRKLMTILFSDIRGFSDITDSLEPEEICHLLNRYLSEMIRIVHEHDGTLNKMVGDGLLVFFNDPIPLDDHAAHAVRMAVQMQQQVSQLRDEWRQYGHELGVGMGINTGFVTVGNMGSPIHRDYTVIGSQVNVAARLESLAKSGEILVSHRTYSRIRDRFPTEEVGEIRIKGIHSPVTAHLVLWQDI
jgi:class 3 adenylate cyclase